MPDKAMNNKSWFVPVILTILGFLGNYFSMPLFFGADFLFGSIPVFLILYFYGLRWGMVAAIMVHGYTYLLWGHPYGFINFTCEALFVGILLKRGHRNLVVLDVLFWLFFGILFVFVEHGIIMRMDATTVVFIMLKQSVNGIFNSLLAVLAIYHLPISKVLRRPELHPNITLRESLFSVLITMILLPALILTILQVRHEKHVLEAEVINKVQLLSTNLQLRLYSWYKDHLQVLNGLAVLAEMHSMTPSMQLQHDIQILHRTALDFRTIHVENAKGIVIAFDPWLNEKGISNIGLDFSGRSWFQFVKAEQRPYVSEAFVGQAAVFSPILNFVVPIMKKDSWLGCATGTLDLAMMQEILRSYDVDKAAVLTIIDNQNQIIASTEPDRKIMRKWERKKTSMWQPVNDSMYLWQPDDKKLPSMTRWKQSFYIQETLIGPEFAWRLIVESPIAPLQRVLYTIYVKNLVVMAALIVLALFLSNILSIRLARPLARLAQVTTDWPQKLLGAQHIDWPEASTHEVDSLIGNFKSMTGALEMNFQELKAKHDEIGQVNSELTQEIRERREIEESLRKSEDEAKRLYEESVIIAKIGQIISSNLNIDEVYGKFAEEAAKLIPFDGISIPLINHADDSATLAYATGMAKLGRNKGDTFPLAGSMIKEVVRTRSGMFIHIESREDIRDSFPMLLDAFDKGIRSVMVVPLIIQDKVIGVIHIRSFQPNIYSDRHLKLAESIASQVAGAIANAQLYAELKQTEAALRLSEKKYRDIFENTALGISLVTLDGKYLSLNPAQAKMYGYDSPEEMIESVKDIARQLYVHPGERKRFRELIDTYGRVEGFESERYRKDGSRFWVSVHSRAIYDDDGNILYCQGTVEDITERKRLEAQLRHAQKMEAVGTLAGGIAHDFNNLLMTILGYTSLMLMDTDVHDPNHEKLKIIEGQVQSGTDLTRQLLGFARGGKYEVKTSNLNELLTRSSDMFGRTKKEISINNRLDENLWHVEADQGQIEQVFLNLFVNAWQAMPGGGTLYIETANIVMDKIHAEHSELKPGKYAKISVTDTGVGMNEITRQRIFDPFFTTKEFGKGTGLGLASAYGIIRNHGGTINVYSEEGKGTTFNIYIPASSKALSKEKPVTGELLKGTETVLLVDDQDAVLKVGKAILIKLGYTVLTATSGEEAVEVYRNNREDIGLVILDMIMPVMSGGETYTILKEINPRIKVILSSGYSMNGQAVKIMEEGCNGFIQKPFNVAELSKKIREALS